MNMGINNLNFTSCKILINETGMKSDMEDIELEKSKALIIIEIIEYVPNAVLSKTIIKKATGNITVSAFDAGEE